MAAAVRLRNGGAGQRAIDAGDGDAGSADRGVAGAFG
jgi:hypothetical protein